MLQSDASLQGWGLAHSFWLRETVAEGARTLERSRFRRIDPHPARKSALVSAQLEVKSDGDLESSPRNRRMGAGYWIDLQRSRWKQRGRCGVVSEDVSMHEARAMVLSIRRLARTQYGGSIRQLFYVTIWGSCSLLDAADLATLEF